MKRLSAAIAALWFGAQAGAAELDDFTAFYVIGDSLSDFGLAYAAVGDPPSPPYAQRFSDGPVWNEYIGAGYFSNEPFFSYAVGGAQALTNADMSPDLPYQKGLFFGQDPLNLFDLTPFTLEDARGDPGERPLMALAMGNNDMLRSIGDADTNDVADAAVDEIGLAISDFAAAGVSDFMVFNLPDLALTPRYQFERPDEAGEATAASLYFNQALDAELGRFSDVNITQIDIFSEFNNIVADLESFGFLDTLVPCITGDPTDPSAVCPVEERPRRVFFDGIHVNSTTQMLLAGIVEDAYASPPAPIPLPSALPLSLAGLAFLFGIGRRTS
jgi:outer membrane lipase/esterase